MKTSDRPDEKRDLGTAVLRQRYLRKDGLGQPIESPEEMFRRVSRTIAAVEIKYGASPADTDGIAHRFFESMAKRLFLPNSPTLMNAGREGGLLSACFVLPVPDSIDGIFDAVKSTATIQKAGGGTGFAFDGLRPTGDIVASSGGTTSGPISFIRVFAEATRAIQQGAFRRGANMGMMSIEHPDILNFVAAKQDPGALDNFNISVKVPDDWMKGFLREPGSPHVVVNPRTGEKFHLPKTIRPGTYRIQDLVPVAAGQVEPDSIFSKADVWGMIVRNAHASGEPGIVFIDRVNAENPTPHVGRIEATNPCGEQPLQPFESCNLGSIDVAKFVREDGVDLEWDRLEKAIRLAVRFLDNVIDANHHPLPDIEKISLGNRKIGLGVMGFADACVLLRIRYDSDEAVGLAGRVAKFLTERAHEASEDLAKERGSFPNWAGSTWETQHRRPMRNATCTTIAPTGSISVIAGCSSGIEPIYSLACKRRALDGQEFVSVHPLLEELGRRGGWMDDRVREALLQGESPARIPGVPGKLAAVLVTAHDVPPECHVRIQAAFQRHIDNAVSKTVNLRADAAVKDVDAIYRLAHRLGCKGVTVYRDGSRQGQTLSKPSPRPTVISPRPRARLATGQTAKFRMGCGTLFVTVNRDETGLCEVFANLGKAGGCPSQSEATCRAISAALRSGVDPRAIIEQLKGIRCLSTSVARQAKNGVDVLSCPDAIAKAIEEALAESPVPAGTAASGRPCPHCQTPMRRESGCDICDRCGFNSCG